MDEAAADLLGENIESSIRLQTFRPRWYHNSGTGTFLDFLVLIFLFLPGLLSRKQGDQQKTSFCGQQGQVYCVLTPTRIAFLGIATGWFKVNLTHELATRPKSDLIDMSFSHAHSTPVAFQFADAETYDLYYAGVWSELEEFRKAAMERGVPDSH